MVTTVGTPLVDTAPAATNTQAAMPAGGADQSVAAQFEALLAGETTSEGGEVSTGVAPRSGVRGWRSPGGSLLDGDWPEGPLQEARGRGHEDRDGSDGAMPFGFDLATLLPLLTGRDARLPSDGTVGVTGTSDDDAVGGDDSTGGDLVGSHDTLGGLVSAFVSERGGLHLGSTGEAHDDGLHLGEMERLMADALGTSDVAVDGGGRRLDADGADAKTETPLGTVAPPVRNAGEGVGHGPAKIDTPDLGLARPSTEAPAHRPADARTGDQALGLVAAAKRSTAAPPSVVVTSPHVSMSDTPVQISQPPVEVASPAEPLPMADQLVQALRVQWRDGGGEATVTLHPEFLGEVSISLRVEDGGMTAVVRAEQSEVRDWIQSNIGLLRDRLQEQGLTLHKFDVSDGYQTRDGQPRDDRGNGRPFAKPARRQARTIDTNTVFEVTA